MTDFPPPDDKSPDRPPQQSTDQPTDQTPAQASTPAADRPAGPPPLLSSPSDGQGPEPEPDMSARPIYPWEDPDLGRPAALGRTMAGVLFGANRFFTGHRPQSLSAAVSFGFLLSCSVTLVQLLLLRLFPGVFSKASSFTRWFPDQTPVFWIIIAGLALTCLFLPMAVAFYHLILRAFTKASGGWAATWRATSYAQAVGLLMAIPQVDAPLWWLYQIPAIIWTTYVLVIGLARLHRITGGKVVLAYVWSFLILFGLVIVGVVIYGVMRA